MAFPKFPARIVYPNLNNSTEWWYIHLSYGSYKKSSFYLDTENKAEI